MSRLIDLTGKRFGRVVVLYLYSKKGKCIYWWCRCDCGNTKGIDGNKLRSGNTVSCGCRKKETFLDYNAEMGYDGRSNIPEYQIYYAMMYRCYNQNCDTYEYYGGRGITVCERWRNSFQAFYEDKGPRPSPEHSLDRFPDPNGPYSNENTRWATKAEQSRNTRAIHQITYDGRTLCVAEWAEILGIGYDTLQGRLEVWSIERAFTEPVQSQERSHLVEGKHLLTHNGITQCLTEWAKHIGMDTRSLKYRIKHWGLEKALTEPVRHR